MIGRFQLSLFLLYLQPLTFDTADYDILLRYLHHAFDIGINSLLYVGSNYICRTDNKLGQSVVNIPARSVLGIGLPCTTGRHFVSHQFSADDTHCANIAASLTD